MSDFASESNQAAQEEGQLGSSTVEDSAHEETLGGHADPGHNANLEKDPSDWVSGDDPMTPAQKSYLDTLAKQAGEELPADLNKAEASENIDRLKNELGR